MILVLVILVLVLVMRVLVMMVLVVMLALMMMGRGRTGGQSGREASGRWRKRGISCLIRTRQHRVSWRGVEIMRSAKWIFYLSSFVNLPSRHNSADAALGIIGFRINEFWV